MAGKKTRTAPRLGFYLENEPMVRIVGNVILTPEMVDEGIRAYYDWRMMDDADPRSASLEFAVSEIFRRMAGRSGANCQDARSPKSN